MPLMQLLIILILHNTLAFVPAPRSASPQRLWYSHVLDRRPSAPTTDKYGEVIAQLRHVIDPDLLADIVTLGFVRNLTISEEECSKVKFVLELTTPACPVKDDLKSQCITSIEKLPWVESATVSISSQPIQSSAPEKGGAGVSQVANLIAVSSCKGGVGKSTTAVNLAFALHRQGARVGILDADIYGPSLPTMVRPDSDAVEFVGSQIRPLMRMTGVDGEGRPRGVKLMSFGYINPGAAAVMRGPMVIQLINQLLSLTHWGELDYLVIDMPPGTGDIPLTLCQSLNMTAAVIVTTPQRLSFTDVVKGIDMFDTVNVPCVAVVENMAHYEVAALDHDRDDLSSETWQHLRQEITDAIKAHRDADDEKVADDVLHAVQSRLTDTLSLPLMEEVSRSGDLGTPLLYSHPDSKVSHLFVELASRVVREVAKLKHSRTRRRPSVQYLPVEHKIAVDLGGLDDDTRVSSRQLLHPAELRRMCRCAACVEEMTGRQILQPGDVPESIKPNEVGAVGNYAVGITWSDGHKSLFPYRLFVKDYDEDICAML